VSARVSDDQFGERLFNNQSAYVALCSYGNDEFRVASEATEQALAILTFASLFDVVVMWQIQR
jgi:hypothetical protein